MASCIIDRPQARAAVAAAMYLGIRYAISRVTVDQGHIDVLSGGRLIGKPAATVRIPTGTRWQAEIACGITNLACHGASAAGAVSAIVAVRCWVCGPCGSPWGRDYPRQGRTRPASGDHAPTDRPDDKEDVINWESNSSVTSPKSTETPYGDGAGPARSSRRTTPGTSPLLHCAHTDSSRWSFPKSKPVRRSMSTRTALSTKFGWPCTITPRIS